MWGVYFVYQSSNIFPVYYLYGVTLGRFAYTLALFCMCPVEYISLYMYQCTTYQCQYVQMCMPLEAKCYRGTNKKNWWQTQGLWQMSRMNKWRRLNINKRIQGTGGLPTAGWRRREMMISVEKKRGRETGVGRLAFLLVLGTLYKSNLSAEWWWATPQSHNSIVSLGQ